MKTNQKGIELIKEAEGCRLEAYPDGKCFAVGYGTTRINGAPIEEGMTVSAQEAEEYLKQDLANAELDVARLVKVNLTSNQHAALVSFAHNLGGTNLRTSTLLKKLNSGDYAGAADEFDKWVYSNHKVLAGLVTRRQKEKALFLS